MNENGIRVTSPLWRWTSGNGVAWFFVTVDGSAGEALAGHALMDRLERGRARGWGSIKIMVTIGESTWPTSAFPVKEGGWMVPVKASIRRAEGLVEGEDVAVVVTPAQ